MAQEFEYKGFPQEILGGESGESLPQGDSLSPIEEPVLKRSDAIQTNPFYDEIRRQINDGTISGATDEWIRNNAKDITPENGFTREEVDRYGRILHYVNNPIPMGIDDGSPRDTLLPGIEDSPGMKTASVGVAAPIESKVGVGGEDGDKGRPNSADQVSYPKLRMNLGVLRNIASGSNDSDYIAQAQALGVDTNDSEGVNAEISRIESQIQEMEASARAAISADRNYTQSMDEIRLILQGYRDLRSAEERSRAAETAKTKINNLRANVAANSLRDASRGAVNHLVNQERESLLGQLNSKREQYDTTHDEIIKRLKDPNTSLADVVYGKTKEDQYRLLREILVEIGIRDNTPINGLPADLRTKVLDIESWIKKYQSSSPDMLPTQEQPLHPEVAEVMRASIRMIETHRVVRSIKDLKAKDGNEAMLSDLMSKGRLAGPEDIEIAFGLKTNSLLVGQLEVFAVVDNLARGNVVGQDGKVVEWSWYESELPNRTNLVRDASLGHLSDPELRVQLAEAAYMVTGEFAVHDKKLRTKLGKLANFKASRSDMGNKKMSGSSKDDPGPMRTINLFPSLYTSAIRRAVVDGKYVFRDDIWKQAIALANKGDDESILRSRALFLEVFRADPNLNSHYLSEENFSLKGVSPNFLVNQWGAYATSCDAVADYLLRTNMKPADFSTEELPKIKAAFGGADPTIGVGGPLTCRHGLHRFAPGFIKGVYSEVVLRGEASEDNNKQGWAEIEQVETMLDNLIGAYGMFTKKELDAILALKEERDGVKYTYDVKAYALKRRAGQRFNLR